MIRRRQPLDGDLAYRGSSKDGRVFLTFDDGPDPLFTPLILDILALAKVQATFFLVGRNAVRFPSLVRRIAEEGHHMGNHTWSHCHPWTVPCSVARQEVSRTSAALSDLVGFMPRYFRPPYGRLRRCMVEQARELGQIVVMWSLSAVDWGPWGRAKWIIRRLRQVEGGDIILFHDGQRRYNRPWETARVLGEFLSEVHNRELTPCLLDWASGDRGFVI